MARGFYDMKILEAENITKQFYGVTALEKVSFDLRRGEVHALVGENGAGKSTLIKILSGVWPSGSFEGSIRMSGTTVRFHSIADAEAVGIAVIYQELALVPDMTVAENIFLGNEPARGGLIDWNQLYAETQRLLALYGLELDPSGRVSDLGIGQQQLVEIVKALSKNSRVLLLDEPTAALTELEVEVLLGIIRGLRDRGISCIYISHKLDEVLSIADRLTVLRDGRSVASVERETAVRSEIVRSMVGREVNEQFPPRKVRTGDTLLEVRDLEVTQPGRGRPVIRSLNLSVRAGEVVGLGGLMGSGRTELLMHLFGAYGNRTAGTVLLRGEPLVDHTPADAIARGLTLVSEDRKRYGLVMEMDIGFNLSLSSLSRSGAGLLLDAHAEFLRNRAMHEDLAIRSAGMEQPVATLSGGNQQKVVLGKALMTEPSVIFLDEPTRGIDIGAKLEIYHGINRLAEEGKGIVMVSSDLPELIGMADRMVILSEGQIGGTFCGEEGDQESILSAAMAYH